MRRRERVAGDEPRPALPAVGVVVLDPAPVRQRQRVDAVADDGQDRGQQRDRRGHRHEHDERRRVAERGHQRDVDDGQREQRDHHRRAREHHRAARRRRRARDRLPRLHAVPPLGLVACDDEQRVVDPHAEADHRRQRRRDGRHLGDLADQRDDRQPADEADDRGDDRQPHGHDRPEREQQDDDGHRQPDHLARVRLGLGDLLAHVAAEADRQAGVARGIGLVDDPLGVVGRQVARARAQVERDVAGPRVLGQDVLGGERAGGGADVGVALERRDRVVDRLLVLGVGELGALRRR